MASLLHVCCEGCGYCPVIPMSIDEFNTLKKHHPEIMAEFLQFKISFIYCRQIDNLVMFQAHNSEIKIKASKEKL